MVRLRTYHLLDPFGRSQTEASWALQKSQMADFARHDNHRLIAASREKNGMVYKERLT